MSKILKLNSETLNEANFIRRDVMHGLERGEIGFVLSMPEMGKSYFCISLAYELATGFPLVNLTQTSNGKAHRVLFWSAEDSAQTLLSRIRNHFDGMSSDLVEMVSNNLNILQHDVIGCSYLATSERKREIERNILELIEIAKAYDFLIIDTLREAAGDADEVQDDLSIKLALQKIAKEANIAVFVSHHVTKSAGRGEERLTAISGSGFSRTLANARLGLALHYNEKSKEDTKYISHVKANNVHQPYRLKKSQLYFSNWNLLSTQSKLLSEWHSNTNLIEDSYEIDEPKEIVLSDIDIDTSHSPQEYVPINDKQLEAYERFLAQKDQEDQNS